MAVCLFLDPAMTGFLLISGGTGMVLAVAVALRVLLLHLH